MTRRRRFRRALVALALGLTAGGGGSGLAQAAPAASTGATIVAQRCNISATGTYRLGANVTSAAISVAVYMNRPGDFYATLVSETGVRVSRRSGFVNHQARARRSSGTSYYTSVVLNYRVGSGPVRVSRSFSRTITTRCP